MGMRNVTKVSEPTIRPPDSGIAGDKERIVIGNFLKFRTRGNNGTGTKLREQLRKGVNNFIRNFGEQGDFH